MKVLACVELQSGCEAVSWLNQPVIKLFNNYGHFPEAHMPTMEFIPESIMLQEDCIVLL